MRIARNSMRYASIYDDEITRPLTVIPYFPIVCFADVFYTSFRPVAVLCRVKLSVQRCKIFPFQSLFCIFFA